MNDPDMARALAQAGPRMRAWLALMGYAGLRCAEVAALERGWLLPGAVRVVGTGGHARVVPLHPTVVAALAGVDLASAGPVFRNGDGRPFRPKDVSRRVAAYLEGLGIAATAHQGRHFFGTVAYRHSHDLRAVQQLLGHADPATTAGYAAVDAHDLAAVVDAIP